MAGKMARRFTFTTIASSLAATICEVPKRLRVIVHSPLMECMYLPPQKETNIYNTGFDESFVGEVLIVQSISKLNHIIIKMKK